jgi:CSLREA domain-containing protein
MDDAPHASPLDGTCTSILPRGACTLRAAIQAANFLGGGPHAINLSTPGTYTLTAVGPNEDNAATGDLDVNGTTVAIANTSNGLVAIDGNHTDRVLSVGRRAPAHLSLSGVTIQNGAVPGASIPPNSGGGLDVGRSDRARARDPASARRRSVQRGDC